MMNRLALNGGCWFSTLVISLCFNVHQNQCFSIGRINFFEALPNSFIVNDENGARYRFRTCDPYRVKVMLYH